MSDRQIGLGMATALVVGNTIGMGIFMQPAALAPFGLNALTGWAAVIVGCICLAITFAALARKLPQADGPFGYVRSTLGEVIAFPALWCYWISVWVTNAVLSIGVVGYFINVFPAAASIPPAALAVSFMWIFVAVNLLGIKSGGRVQVVTSLLKIVPLLLVMVVGAFSILASPGSYTPNLPTTPITGQASMAAAAVALYAMLGFESAAIAAGRVKDPQRTIPRATLIGTLISRGHLRRHRRDRPARRAAGDARHLRRALRHDHRPPARTRQRPLGLAVRRHQRARLPERLDAALRRAHAHAGCPSPPAGDPRRQQPLRRALGLAAPDRGARDFRRTHELQRHAGRRIHQAVADRVRGEPAPIRLLFLRAIHPAAPGSRRALVLALARGRGWRRVCRIRVQGRRLGAVRLGARARRRGLPIYLWMRRRQDAAPVAPPLR